MLAPLLQPGQDDVRQQVAEAGGAQRQDDVRPEEDRCRDDREEHGRRRDADTEKDHQRFAVAEAGGDEAALQFAHLRGRLRGNLPHPLEGGRQLLPRRSLEASGAADLREAAFDVPRHAGRERHIGSRREQRHEHEREQGQEDRHTTPRS